VILMPGLSPEEELAWVQQEFQGITKEKLDEIGSMDAVRKLLESPETKEYSEYRFNDVVIRYRKFPTSKLRRMLSSAKMKVGDAVDPLQTQDRIVYDALAEICVDDPWTNPVAWAKVDAGTSDGRVYQIFTDIMEKIGGGEKSLKKFR